MQQDNLGLKLLEARLITPEALQKAQQQVKTGGGHLTAALIKIGASGQASIDVVAGPVGEALIMTALGLVVAVPAVLAYNWLVRRNKSIMEDLAAFTNDLHGYLMSEGRVKPRVGGAPKADAARATTAAPGARTQEPLRTGTTQPADRV